MDLSPLGLYIKSIPQCRQVQYSLNKQLCVLHVAAVKLGIDMPDFGFEIRATSEDLDPEDKAVVDRLVVQPTADFTLQEKMALLRFLAVKLGLYDASDFLNDMRQQCL